MTVARGCALRRIEAERVADQGGGSHATLMLCRVSKDKGKRSLAI
jgi:hypothetical protein